MALSPQASAAAQPTSSSIVWLPLLTFSMPGRAGTLFPNLPAGRSTLNAGDTLTAGQALVSPNGWYQCVMQADGNLAIYSKAGALIWHSNTWRYPGSRAVMQGDGNFVIYSAAGAAVFATGTGAGVRASLQNDGQLAVWSASSGSVWATGVWSPDEPRDTVLRVVSNTENITSRGQLFQATHFDLTLPTDNGEQFPYVELKIANVDSMLIQGIRGFREPPRLLLEIVLSDRPDIVERAVDFLVLREVNYDAITISGRLAVESALQNRFPAYDYIPPYFPGLFT